MRRSSSSRRAASRFSTQGRDGKRTRESDADCRPSTSASSDATNASSLASASARALLSCARPSATKLTIRDTTASLSELRPLRAQQPRHIRAELGDLFANPIQRPHDGFGPEDTITRNSTHGQGLPAKDAAEWRRQREDLREWDRDSVPRGLGPPALFSDRRRSAAERKRCGLDVPDGETGRRSWTVTSRLRMSCAGWRKVPTAEVFHDAVHRPAGIDREAAILLTWFHEAEMAEQLHARLGRPTVGASLCGRSIESA